MRLKANQGRVRRHRERQRLERGGPSIAVVPVQIPDVAPAAVPVVTVQVDSPAVPVPAASFKGKPGIDFTSPCFSHGQL